jgi:CHAT domain-containing protein
VLISPDGPLHLLPFAALVRPGPRTSFLLEGKPLHTVLSATLYAELTRDRPPRRQGPVVAFADPLYRRASAGASPGDRPLRRYLQGLPPLPGAREEVRSLASLFGADAVIYLGPEATEKRAKALPARARSLHFACHALLDPRFPLDSALALSVPLLESDGDGLLQAWEIFERVRLDADLVTLSACETGLGRNAAGEGLIGLTRAFQYAGARSIVASLWSVSDRSTAELMRRFYTLLRAGGPKDLALQTAQREMVRGGGASSHPYHWAAFELIGDWR